MNFGNDHNRDEHAYEEDDFDMREDYDFEDDEEEGGLLRWVSVLFVLAALGGFVALAWYAYQSGMQPVSEDEIPYVAASDEPLKETPEEPGGWQFEHQDKAVYNQLASGEQEKPVAERLMPAPEEPVERKVEQILPQDYRRETVAEVSDSAAATEVVVVDESPEKAAQAALNHAQDNAAAKAAAEAAAAKAAAEARIAAEKAAAEKAASEKAAQAAAAAKAAEAAKQEAARKAAAAKAAASKPAASAAPAGTYLAQLGAFSSQGEATAAWQKIQSKHGSMFPTKQHYVERADLGAKGVFYRLQIGTFSTDAAARKLCDYLQQQKQGCFVVKK